MGLRTRKKFGERPTTNRENKVEWGRPYSTAHGIRIAALPNTSSSLKPCLPFFRLTETESSSQLWTQLCHWLNVVLFFKERGWNKAIRDQIQNIESNHHRKKERERTPFKESLRYRVFRSCLCEELEPSVHTHTPSSALWRLERIHQRGNRVVAAVSPLFT